MFGKKFGKTLIRPKATWQLPSQDVTPESVFRQRRQLLQALGLGAIGTSVSAAVQASLFDWGKDEVKPASLRPLKFAQTQYGADLRAELTPERKIISHNNFYEFGTDKSDPQQNAQQFQTNPWQLQISGLVEQPLRLSYQDLFELLPLEERIYRLRCVEAWSMVIPWVGFPLKSLLDRVGAKTSARYVAFETLYDPKQMPGQADPYLGGGIHYPYVEGLTLAEAMNELTFVAVGLYGKTLPPQNGAPIRLVVPWKYGFKSIKSITKIHLLEKQPPTTWQQLAPHEYGFYANVNPEVDHPRWSQGSERRIGSGGLFSAKRIPTQLFNGYGDQVADLYQGLDLTRHY